MHPPLLADDEAMESVASQTFEGEGQLSNSDPVSISQMNQWHEWFNAHFRAAILEHQNANQRFQEPLMAKIESSNEEFKQTIGEKLLAGLGRVTTGLSQQSAEEKRQTFETLSGYSNSL